MIKKVIYLTRTRPNYSLNSVLIKGLKENKVEVAESHIKNRGISGFIKAVSFYRQEAKNTDALIIGYDSPVLVFLSSFFCRKKIIYNAVLSVYERMIISRRLAPRLSLRAGYYWLIDFLAVHCADLIMVESDGQADFFKKLFKVSGKKIYKSWIGVDGDKFFYDPVVPKHGVFTVVFRGALQHETGAEYAVKAAKILEKENIRFVLHSGGLLLGELNKIIDEIKPVNMEIKSNLLSFEELRSLMQKCHLCLGQLSGHPRLERTIPHKAYESLAMRLPYLTASNSGVLELLTPDETCLICNSADAKSLAEKILWAKNNYSIVEKMAENGYKLYQDKLKSVILAKNLLDKIGEL